MNMILFVGKFVGIYLLMVGAGFISNFAYHGDIHISTWSSTGRNWMIFFPLVVSVIFMVMEIFGEESEPFR